MKWVTAGVRQVLNITCRAQHTADAESPPPTRQRQTALEGVCNRTALRATNFQQPQVNGQKMRGKEAQPLLDRTEERRARSIPSPLCSEKVLHMRSPSSVLPSPGYTLHCLMLVLMYFLVSPDFDQSKMRCLCEPLFSLVWALTGLSLSFYAFSILSGHTVQYFIVSIIIHIHFSQHQWCEWTTKTYSFFKNYQTSAAILLQLSTVKSLFKCFRSRNQPVKTMRSWCCGRT